MPSPNDLALDACRRGDPDALRRALEGGADPDARDPRGRSLAILCATHDQAACLATLLERPGKTRTWREILDASANARFRHNPFLMACIHGSEGCLHLLLDHGEDPNQVNGLGWSGLIFAAEIGNASCARLLLERGADPRAATLSGSTPSAIAAEQGHVDILRLLARHGVDVIGATASDGRSTAFVACAAGKLACLRFLADLGADLRCLDREGKTMAQAAREQEFFDCAAFVEARLEDQVLQSHCPGASSRGPLRA